MKYIAIFFVLLYKKVISPWLPHQCRFTPTCSDYMIQSLKSFGLIKGLFLGIKRIAKCNP
ncbi:MAG: membrane protein insertion efficiency factor YidD, partial [Rickettsiales bacterium]|nr:membrane protein insertion efficiency factor YidD [Rickettsiales bacterium]